MPKICYNTNMRIFLTIFLLLLFVSSAFAKVPENLNGSLPDGVFKKNHRGQFVQYNNKGKKIGVYEFESGKFVKIK